MLHTANAMLDPRFDVHVPARRTKIDLDVSTANIYGASAQANIEAACFAMADYFAANAIGAAVEINVYVCAALGQYRVSGRIRNDGCLLRTTVRRHLGWTTRRLRRHGLVAGGTTVSPPASIGICRNHECGNQHDCRRKICRTTHRSNLLCGTQKVRCTVHRI